MSPSEALPIVNLPETQKGIDQQKAHLCIDNMPNEKAKEMAKFLVDHIDGISFKDFMISIVKCTKELMVDLEDRPYIVVLPYNNDECKQSENWVATLAQAVSTNAPIGYVSAKDVSQYLKEHDQIQDLVWYDDASYSGFKIGDPCAGLGKKLTELYPDKSYSFHIAVGYATNAAIDHINEQHQRYASNHNLSIHVGKKMKTLSEIIEPIPENVIYRETLKKYFAIDLSRVTEKAVTLTWFEHKGAADGLSFPNAVRDGEVRDENGKWNGVMIPFIPKVNVPYHK